MDRKEKVPQFKRYFPSYSDLSPEQAAFYDLWLRAWKRGTPIPIDGQMSYLLLYLYSVLDSPPREIIPQLQAVRAAYKSESIVERACSAWISDCHVLLGDYDRALEELPKPILGSRASNSSDSILSLRLAIGQDVNAETLLALAGPGVTSFGRKHLPEVARFVEIQLEQRAKHGEAPLLPDWARDSYSYTYFVFSGSSQSRGLPHLKAYSFSMNPRALAFAANQARQAENTVRAESHFPAVGEGWLSETELYYQIKGRFPGLEVVQHASPPWLRGQHLDVYIPDLAVALEFQGIQHDRPVDYFGGQEAFRQVKRRDAMKKRKCTLNSVALIEVRHGYLLDDVIENILKVAARLPKENDETTLSPYLP